MAAGEDHGQPLVAQRALLGGGEVLVMLEMGERSDRSLLAALDRGPAEPIDRLASRRRDEPAGGVGRHPFEGPPLQHGDACVMQCVLGHIDVADSRGPGRRGSAPARPAALG